MKAAEVTVTANNGTSVTLTLDVPSGYTIVAVADWYSTAWELSITKASINGNTVECFVYNPSSSNHTATIGISVLVWKS